MGDRLYVADLREVYRERHGKQPASERRQTSARGAVSAVPYARSEAGGGLAARYQAHQSNSKPKQADAEQASGGGLAARYQAHQKAKQVAVERVELT